jgi:hypothetical protein
MVYTKKEFGLELHSKVNNCDDYNIISKWAYKVYIDQGLAFEDGLDNIVLKLMMMEEGPEFVLTRDYLLFIANELINGK